jgi:uncharacterized protein (DUF1778 family)
MPKPQKRPPKKAEPPRRKDVRKEDQIRLRVTAEQKTTLTEAAEKAGLGVSSWLLTLGLREARELLKE